MKLTELGPRLNLHQLFFRCPACRVELIGISFAPGLDGTPCPPEVSTYAWRREAGTTVDDLTVSPSIAAAPHGFDSPGVANCQGWHGFLRAGELVPA